jgi:6-pyruvoyltetrahydropterin/6-carboxytetrahydropterin synthase
MLLTRRYHFSASHRLHSLVLSEQANQELYGKCNNPFGHGHNYEVEVTVNGPIDERTGRVIDPRDLDAVVARYITGPFEHRNLNEEVPEFQHLVPTTENLNIIVDRRLRAAWPEAFSATFPHSPPSLERVRIYETPRNIFETEAPAAL